MGDKNPDLNSRDNVIYATVWLQGFNHQDMVHTSWNKMKTSAKHLLNAESSGVPTWLIATLVTYIRDKTIISSLLGKDPCLVASTTAWRWEKYE